MKENILKIEDLVVAFSMYKSGTFKKEKLEVIHSLFLQAFGVVKLNVFS